MRLEDMQELIGQKVYMLRVGQLFPSSSPPYAYRIYPQELTVQEVRMGEARRESDKEYYGPGFVTWLCRHEKGYVQAFSPVGDEILGNSFVAGRNTRAFLNQDELYQEAQILKECIAKNYKHVAIVEIALPERGNMLDSKIQDACVRAETGFCVVKDQEKISILKE